MALRHLVAAQGRSTTTTATGMSGPRMASRMVPLPEANTATRIEANATSARRTARTAGRPTRATAADSGAQPLRSTWPAKAPVCSPCSMKTSPFTIVGRSRRRAGRTDRRRGEVVHVLGQRQREGVPVDHVHVGDRARPEHAAVGDADEVGGVGGDAADGLLDRHQAALAHPVGEEEGRLAGVEDLAHVGTGVGEAHHDHRCGQHLGDDRRSPG